MEDIKKRNLCFILLIIAFIVLMTGCGKQELTKGVLEGYSYEETEETTEFVKIVTDKEEVILIELYPEIAPITVANFQKLVKDKFYDNLIFHRVMANFMIQTGDPNGTGYGGSEETIKGDMNPVSWT